MQITVQGPHGTLFEEKKILPIDQLIKYSRIKLMHSFQFKQLPVSFAETWITNNNRNMDRILRNANDLYVPRPIESSSYS